MKKRIKNSTLARPLALALLLPTLAAVCLASCRRADGSPAHSLVVGVDEFTEDPALTSPEVTSDCQGSGTIPQDETTRDPDLPVTKPVTEETTQLVDVVSYDYDVVMLEEVIAEVGAQKSRKILRYPKLTGLSNPDMQSKINTLLGDIAADEFKKRLLGLADYTQNGIAVKYEITKTAVTYLGGNLLSVRSEGAMSYSDGSADSPFVYSNIINLSTGRNVSQKKVYSDFGEIKKLFEADRFRQISGMDKLTSSISLADMMSQYAMYELYNTYPDTYFTPNDLVIVIELNRNLGGFAEFSIPLADVNAYLSMSPTK